MLLAIQCKKKSTNVLKEIISSYVKKNRYIWYSYYFWIFLFFQEVRGGNQSLPLYITFYFRFGGGLFIRDFIVLIRVDYLLSKYFCLFVFFSSCVFRNYRDLVFFGGNIKPGWGGLGFVGSLFWLFIRSACPYNSALTAKNRTSLKFKSFNHLGQDYSV